MDFSTRAALFLGLALVQGAGCASLKLTLVNASVQKPSNVALYFAAETSAGVPVAGLDAKAFRIYEDGHLISPYESKQTILNPEIAVAHYIVLLLDVSGSITESGSLETLVGAASRFADKVSKRQKVAVFGFEGGKRLIPVTGFTSSPAAIKGGLRRLASRKSRDSSTNLNGAVVEALAVLKNKLKASSQPLRFATLVVFTDGTDRAHRVSVEKMHEAVDKAAVNVFVIGLGVEIDKKELARLGRDGFVTAQEGADVAGAFDEVARRIEAASKKFYLLSYCSPSRAGDHKLRVELKAMGQSGSLEHDFAAAGFGPRCNPNRKPRFSVHNIKLAPHPR